MAMEITSDWSGGKTKNSSFKSRGTPFFHRKFGYRSTLQSWKFARIGVKTGTAPAQTSSSTQSTKFHKRKWDWFLSSDKPRWPNLKKGAIRSEALGYFQSNWPDQTTRHWISFATIYLQRNVDDNFQVIWLLQLTADFGPKHLIFVVLSLQLTSVAFLFQRRFQHIMTYWSVLRGP